MARLIPGKTKVQIELFKGVGLADIGVGIVAFLMIVFVLISSLPYKFYIILGILIVAGMLLMRMDTVPNYTYLVHMLRHFAYRRKYRRTITDEQLMIPESEREKSPSKKKAASAAAKTSTESQEPKEDPKARKKRIKEEDKKLASKKVPEEEKEEIRQRRREQAKIAAERMILYKEQTEKREPMENLSAFTDIGDGFISYGGSYYGAVLEVPAVEFRFFSDFRRTNTIENGLGKMLRTIHATYGANIVKLERPIHYEEYLGREYEKLEQLRKSYEKGMLSEEELKIRVEIMYERIEEVAKICGDEKIVEPFYYIVLFDGDKRQLENQLGIAVSTLTSAEMQPRRLDDKELAIFLKYSNCLDINEEEIEKLEPSEYARWAMPQTVNVKMRTVEVNHIVTHNMRVVDYPSSVSDAWLAGVFSMPGTKCVIKCRPMDRDKSVRAIDRSLQELRGQFNSTGVDSKRIELQTHIDTLGSLLATLQQDNESLLEFSIYITAYDLAATETNPNVITPKKTMLPRIPNMKRTVRKAWQECGIRVNNMEFTQMEAYIGSQISAWDPMRKESRGIPSNSLAAAYPWIYANVSDVGGIRLGKSEGVPVFVDFFRRDSERVNSNMVIVGKSGSGKSYATKSLLANLAAEDSKIFILDPENEYTELAKNLHGKFINVGNAQNGRLNPFHIITALDDDEGGGAADSYATHLQFLEEFFRQILPDCDKDAMEYLNSLVDRVYINKGITPETDLSKLRPEDYPIFDDLYDVILAEFQQTDNEYIRSNLRVLMNYVAKFSAGGRNSSIWNGHSTITTEENFTVFNFQSLLANRNNTVANAQMLLVLKYIDNEIIKNRDYNTKYGLKRKVVVVIDEAHVFIDTKFPVALDFMFQLAKRIRKYNGMQIVITQNIKDFVGSEEIARKSTAIINACQYSFIFALSPNDIDDLCKLYEKAGGINESEQEQITTAPRGQAFAIMSPASRTTFRIEVPGSLVQMFKRPDYVSQYFDGEDGEEHWEDFLGDSRKVNLQNEFADFELEEEIVPQKTQNKVTFVELDEEEALAELQREIMAEAEAKNRAEAETKAQQEQIQVAAQPEPVKPEPIKPEPRVEPVQQIVQVVQAPSNGDAAAQELAKILGDFSFDAIRSEINHRFEALRRDLEEQTRLQASELAQPRTADIDEPVVSEDGTSVSFKIETAKIPAPEQTPEPEEQKIDYSSMILPEDDQPEEESQSDDFDGIDIMALLSAQAKKMESISPIEMMEVYGEMFTEVTLEDLEKYINKNHK